MAASSHQTAARAASTRPGATVVSASVSEAIRGAEALDEKGWIALLTLVMTVVFAAVVVGERDDVPI